MPFSIALALTVILQQPPDNAAWLAFADSLSRSSDVHQLRKSADQLRRQRDSRSRLRAGLMYHRIYELKHDQDAFDRAAGLLNDGLRQAPKVAAIHYLAGRALVSGPHVTQRGGIITLKVVREMVGSSERNRGIEALESALQLDPLFVPAALELARQAINYRDQHELRSARTALRPIVDRTNNEQARLLLAEVERTLGDPAAAAAALGSGPADKSGGAVARVEYERAMALLLVPQRAGEGVAAYWRGLAALDTETAKSYYNDASYIMTRAEADAWAKTAPNDKTEWFRGFWALHAGRSGVSVDERIMTHYERLAYARKTYWRKPTVVGRGVSRAPEGGFGPREILGDSEAFRRDIDDRGLIWVKYGKPDERITHPDGYEAWIYERDGRNINFFFTVPQAGFPSGEDGFSLFSGVTGCIAGGLEFLMNVARFEPELQRVYTGTCRNASASALSLRSVAATLNERTRENLKHNDARPLFERDVPFHYSLYTLAADRLNQSTIVAAVAVPAGRLTRDDNGAFRIRASLTIIDTVNGTVSRVDTTLNLSSRRALGERDYIRAYLQVSTEPSASTIHRIAIVDANAPSAGAMYGRARPVDAFSTRMALSDLILADTVSRGGWRRGDAALDLVPMEEYPGGAFNLFYEIYNIAAGAYRTEILIEATDGATRRLLSRMLGQERSNIELAFSSDVSTARRTVQELRRVGTELPDGRYRITVQVTDSAGRQAERSRDLRVSR